MFWQGHKYGGMFVNVRLGDMAEAALSLVGITQERVERWVGHPCGCLERKAKLNALGAWAKRILTGNTENAEEHLNSIMLGNKEPEKKDV